MTFFFILGIVFAFLGIPFMQAFSDMIVALIGIANAKFYEQTVKINERIKAITSEDEENSEIYPIGFQISEEEDEEEDDEE